MSTQNIRLGSQLSFEAEQEKDIISTIQYLNNTHKMGQFISNLIRVAFDNPELLGNNSDNSKAFQSQLESLGISSNRKAFFNSVASDIKEMKQKIDSIYNMAFKTYSLSMVGKRLALEQKSDNLLLSTFILEKQLKDLQNTLGIDPVDSIYASNKLDETHDKADDILEYIIESYENITNELKASIQEINTKIIETQPVKQIIQETIPTLTPTLTPTITPTPTPSKTEEYEQKEDKSSEEQQVIDFSNADMNVLANFFDD